VRGAGSKIAVLTDAHANLPALEAALQAIAAEGCEAIYHTGDAIAIGPQPRECVELLLNTPNLQPSMGNHEAWFVHGLPRPQPAWMSDGEVAHQHWVHAQLGSALRAVVARWPWVIQETLAGVRVTLLHYEPAAAPAYFAPVVHDRQPEGMDRLFARHAADLVCYGHDHVAADVSGRARYVSPGSLGCSREAVACFLVLECAPGSVAVHKRAVPYDDTPLFEAFERRQVPERAFLYQAFFGGRCGQEGRKT
jgi:predicted phosphodiesterase